MQPVQGPWFGLLGPLLVRLDGVEIAVPPKLRTLLAALLVRANQRVSVTALAEMVWDGHPTPMASVTLRSYIKRLRQVMGLSAGARIVTSEAGYLIEIAEHELDLLQFDNLFRAGCTAQGESAWRRASELLAQALGMWRGALLADVPSEKLQRSETPRLEQMRLQALEWRIEADSHLGHPGELVPELQALVVEHPLHERFHAQLMQALYRCGRQAESLAAYQQARRILVEEIGVGPGPELQELHQRLLAGDADLAVRASQVPSQLPAAVRHFAGRARELRVLAGLLEGPAESGGTVVITAIDGTAGVGKTALALHWAHQVAGRFPDGRLYINLRGHGPFSAPLTAPQAIRALLDAFGIPAGRLPADPGAQSRLYRSLLAGKRILVVLDNARDAEHVRPLLPVSPGCLAVVTSRTELVSLAVDADAHIFTLDVLSPAEAEELMAGRIGAQRIASEPAAAAELSELCARLPLALAIAAARAAAKPTFPLAALAGEFRDVRSRLDALDAGSATANVRAVFSWSYRQLDEPAARVFRLLGLHPGPDISTRAAASLTHNPVDRTRRVLAELARAHLLTEHMPGRYKFHDLLRTYAAEEAQKAGNEDQRNAAVGRMLDYYLHTSYAASLLLQPTREPLHLAKPAPGALVEAHSIYGEALAWFEAEHAVLLASITLAARMEFAARAWQLAWSMMTFLDRRSYWSDLVAVQHLALAAAQRAGDPCGQAHSQRNLGRAYSRLDAGREALLHLRQAVMDYQQLGDQAGEARASIDLALASERQAQLGQAIRYSRRALELFEAIGHRSGQADALNAIGWYSARTGSYRQALASCQRALTLHGDLGDPPGQAGTLDSLGYIHHRLGRYQEAIVCYQRSLELLQDLGDSYNEAGVLTRLGDARQAAGEEATARDAWQRALVILIDLHHPDAGQVRAKLRLSGTRADFSGGQGAGRL